jgi:hypothetical protein
MTAPSEDYNGWTNRETWAFNLHFGYDEGLAETVNDVYTENLKRLIAEQPDWDADWCAGAAMQYAGDAVEEWYDELRDEYAQNECPFEVFFEIGSAWRINWREIASNFVEDAA